MTVVAPFETLADPFETTRTIRVRLGHSPFRVTRAQLHEHVLAILTELDDLKL